MRFHAVALALVTVALVLAGCAGPAAKPAGTTTLAATEGSDPTGGTIDVTVSDDEARPLEAASVQVERQKLEGTTPENGSLRFTNVPPGTYRLFASALGYESAGKNAEVVAGEVTEVRFILVPIPIVEPYNLTTTFNGRVACGAAAVSPCAVMLLLDDSDPTENKQGPNWSYKKNKLPDEVWIEVSWQPRTGATGQKLAYDFFTASSDGLDRHSMATGNHASPIRFNVTKDVLEAAQKEFPGDFRFVMYPDEEGATVLQDFTLFRTDFYNGPAPPNFTRLPS